MLSFLPVAVLLCHSVQASIDVGSAVFQSSYQPGGLQSGPDDGSTSTIVTSAVYSKIDNSIVMTGTTYGPGSYFQSPEQQIQDGPDFYYGQQDDSAVHDAAAKAPKCFLASIALPGRTEEQQRYFNYQLGDDRDRMFWTRRQHLTSPAVYETCEALHFFPDTGRLVVAGHAEERETLEIQQEVTARVTKQHGLLFDVDWDIPGDKSFKTVGGQKLEDHSVLYPMALDSVRESDEEGVYVAFLQDSHDATLLGAVSPAPTSETWHSMEEGFGMGIARFRIQPHSVTTKTVVEKFEQNWFASFDTTEQSRVQVAAMIEFKKETLLIAGSTDGEGEAYGAKQHSSSHGLDGFITKVQILGDNSDSNSTTIGEVVSHETTALRLASTTRNKDDVVASMCQDPGFTDDVYIVGTTEGHFAQSLHKPHGKRSAFIAKLDPESMRIDWIQQIGGTHRNDAVHGMTCTVTNDGVWIGGMAEDGTAIEGAEPVDRPHGGQDIFVAKLLISSGEIQFLRQLGSTEDDVLARKGGLVGDGAGNIVVVGNTYGSIYRDRTNDENDSPIETSDVFVFTISGFDGAFVEFQPTLLSGGGAARVLLHFSLFVLLMAGSAMLALKCLLGQAPKPTDRSKVSIYLRKFDMDQIDLRHSATGGWHCHYTGRLARGKFKAKDGEQTIMFQQETQYDDLLDQAEQRLLSNEQSDSEVDDSESSAYDDTMDLYNKEFGNIIPGIDTAGVALWGKDIV